MTRIKLTLIAASVAVVLAAGALAAPASGAIPAASPAGQWQVATRPMPTEPNGDLRMVSCSSPNACIGIGQAADRQGRERPVTERWNGANWAPDGLPRPPASLVDLSCAAARSCAAIAYAYPGTQHVVQRLGAGGWTSEELPQPDGASVHYVSLDCPSVHQCVAVGRGTRAHNILEAFAAVWDGHGWTASPLPDIGLRDLTTVSCGAPGSCLAVGNMKVAASGGQPAYVMPRALQLTDGEWQPTAALAFPKPYLSITDVSCSASTACTAVGTGRSCTQGRCAKVVTLVAERWDGTTWTSQTVPNDSGPPAPVVSVSCASATLCAATSSIIGDGHGVVTWDGTAWTQRTVPPPADARFAIADVACAATACQVVGAYNPSVGPSTGPSLGRTQMLVRPFVVDRDGDVHFRTVVVHEPPGPADYTLDDVSCTSTQSCVAVGTLSTEAAKDDLYITRWDGASWTDETVSVATATANGPIESVTVSCSAPGQCMVAGIEALDDSYRLGSAFSVQLDGDTETVRSLGSSTSAFGADVSCTAGDACTAAIDVVDCGQTFGCGHLPDFERWDGTTWHQQTPDAQVDPDHPDGAVAVSCGSATGCVAIGMHNAQVWNGSKWHTENVPAPEGGFSSLTDVSCTAARTCMLVGAQNEASNYAVRFAGQRWTLLPIDDGSAREAFAVSCVAANACSAIGSSQFADDLTRAAARWDGRTWAPQDPPAASGYFVSVSCVAADTCMAVGSGTVSTEGF